MDSAFPSHQPGSGETIAGDWAAIEQAQARLEAALAAGDAEQFAELSTLRHRCIVDFFERFPATADNIGQRAELLRALLADNQRMLETGRTQLLEVARQAAASRHSRRAIRAYRDRSASTEA